MLLIAGVMGPTTGRISRLIQASDVMQKQLQIHKREDITMQSRESQGKLRMRGGMGRGVERVRGLGK